jgi:hypothetical protein
MSTHQAPDIRAYLEIRTASPSSWAPDGSALLVSSNLPGTSQVHRLDLADAEPVPAERLTPLTDFEEPVGAGYLPADPAVRRRAPAAGRHRPWRQRALPAVHDAGRGRTGR